MSKKALILGGGGQLARALGAALGDSALSVSIDEINLNDMYFLDKLDALREQHGFSVIYNAAAYTQVDEAESDEGGAQALWVNGIAVGGLGDWCALRGMMLVHYSTDYVFDGSGDAPRSEEAPTHPLNVYGQTKLVGEQMLADGDARYLVFRTSWLYDVQGKNFFNTMLRLMSEREEISVVADQVGAPTYVPHLAQVSIAALDRACAMEVFPRGVYHLCHAGAASWHEFAQTIFTLAQTHDSALKCKRVIPINTSQYPTPATRPLNSRLDCAKALRELGVSLPHWEEGLAACMEKKYLSTFPSPLEGAG